ncbi:hypothetical protein F8388_025207 [Cannabis sativa]|uniref:Tryptophan synthase beta chain-like PALP domain-containing protein n=1 Tax=Cannabis sativa TaxID=3483 RepID=A0A7J6FS12_CANSA|nr:hypothetical protein F8388_025207 [Cannabis sativa]
MVMSITTTTTTTIPLFHSLPKISQSQSPQLSPKMALNFLTKKPFSPPSWASHLNPLPTHTFSLANVPTPIHKWNLPNLPNNTEIWLKRDDLTGMQMSGNKVRKLEFLLADAVEQGADCIITIGGIQSNHCRATAVAARYLNLDCYLILRTSKALTNHLKEKLISEGRKPYAKGMGYAISTPEELKFVKDIAATTGVVLDPVYSGKAVYALLKDMNSNPKKWEGRKILFVHTGGLLGLYDKVEQMDSLVENWRRMDVPESVPREDGIGKMF